ncbi:DNA-binding response regulator [Rhodoferax lacus]|uniref:DNA-binding response regulator n=1 Tax=Rhodoferax lacus TaxID=2184758 RepID=A0A3E1R842_9BURK|nr:DNA-binding response regulator [Rhodoferax lacus]
MRVLVVDDEELARTRLTTLLADGVAPRAQAVALAANAVEAMHALQHQHFDVVLLDIHMPGIDGLALAQTMQSLSDAPAVIFVTAHAEHALQAFELDATDYLTKPVRLDRLQAALLKAQRYVQARSAQATVEAVQPEEVLLIQDRNRTERLPLDEVVYFKAELKYITVRTALRSFILDTSLNELEEKYGARFMRIHRNALIARHAARALQKHHDPEEGEGWALRLDGVSELLFVSRRQLAAVREMLGRG